MARPPATAQFLNLPRELHPLARILRRFMDDTISALRNGLSVEDNFRVQVNELRFNNNDKVSYEFISRATPVEVKVKSYRISDRSDNFINSSPQVVWTYDGRRITLETVGGIAGSTNYDLVVHTFSEDT